jgi:16S rRNA (cytidine1402-2'-O)-methyltransferase
MVIVAEPGKLIVAGVPLGDVRDASPRLAEALAAADVVAAEDTRRARRLAADLGISLGRVVSYFDGNETARIPGLIDDLRAGLTVILITDAGMPAVSDPGFRLVAAAVAEQIPVSVVAGPSAVTAALALSGLPSDRFCFDGFLPRRPGERRRRLTELVGERRTIVLFEAPHRSAASLADMSQILGPERRAAVCREMTKTYEEVRRGTLGELAEWAAEGLRGELTIVVAGAADVDVAHDPSDLAAQVDAAVAAGATRRDAITAVAQHTGAARKVVYRAAVGDRSAPDA